MPTLYIVATPIGNLEDASTRAIRVLREAHTIFCEDTRVSNHLLKVYGIQASLHAYHDHSNASERHHILKRLKEGQSVALLSDAGTPLISDPG